MQLNVKALGLTSGIIGALGLFTLTWWVIVLEGPSSGPNLISKVYLGYSFTPVGSIIGLAWAFVDGLICGLVFAWLYNKISS